MRSSFHRGLASESALGEVATGRLLSRIGDDSTLLQMAHGRESPHEYDGRDGDERNDACDAEDHQPRAERIDEPPVCDQLDDVDDGHDVDDADGDEVGARRLMFASLHKEVDDVATLSPSDRKAGAAGVVSCRTIGPQLVIPWLRCGYQPVLRDDDVEGHRASASIHKGMIEMECRAR